MVVVAEVVLVAEAALAAVVALLAVDPVVHLAGPPLKGRNAPYGSYLTSYIERMTINDNRNSAFNSLSG